jgi:hypothetical protein
MFRKHALEKYPACGGNTIFKALIERKKEDIATNPVSTAAVSDKD